MEDISYKNHIKKLLYKEKPVARKWGEEPEFIWYETRLEDFSEPVSLRVLFKIPVEEAKSFKEEEPAQLLIRWLYEPSAS